MSDKVSPGAGGSTRRDFLKGSTALAVGGALAGTLSLSRSAHAAGDDTIKIALIGCGGRGTGAVHNAMSTTDKNLKVVALADAFRDRLDGCYNELKKFGDRFEVSEDRKFVGVDAYQKAIDCGIDLAILATPPGFRPIHLAAAVKAGKHVFMEKPVATEQFGVKSVLASAEEAKKKGLAIGVGLQRRHQNSYIETIKRIHDGAIGDVQYTRVYWNGGGVWVRPRQSNQTEMEYQIRNWYYFAWAGGDEICEQHIHNLDVGNWVKNAHPVKANGMGGREVRRGKDFGEIFDHHTVEFEYADGSRMFSQCRHIPGAWSTVDEFAVGTKGKSKPGGSIDGENKYHFKGDNPDPYRQEHEDLLASIRSGNPINEAERGAHSSMTSILGRMATYSGQEISWDQAFNSQVQIMPADFSFNATPLLLPGPDGIYPAAVPGITKYTS